MTFQGYAECLVPPLIDPQCPNCGGTGHIFTNLTARRCEVCLARNLISNKLGWLNKARNIKSSPLAGKTHSNVFILASDDEANAHLKYTFTQLGADERWVYITDSDVLQAWLGKPNPAKAENLQDLVEYPFMVVRLGVLGYKNVALSGVLHELVQLRLLSSLPTWLISHRELRAETCLEYSPELEILISQNFTRVAMARFKAQATESAHSIAMGHARQEVAETTEVELGEALNAGEAAMRSFRTTPKDVSAAGSGPANPNLVAADLWRTSK